MSAAQGLADGHPKKVVMVLYPGGEWAAKQPELVGCVEHALGLRPWLEGQGHQVVATADKDGPTCELERHLPHADVLITM
jgi:formate dehydrogenase